MRKQIPNFRVVCGFTLLLFGFNLFSPAQETGTSVQSLIDRLDEKDEKVVVNAAGELIKVGRSVIPLLADGLRQKKSCQFQFVASGIIYQLDKRNEIVNATLKDIIKGGCSGRSQRDLIIRRQAAFALVAKAEGIPVIAGMLKEGDVFVRRSAAFAFDELTERIEGARPDSIAPTPEIIGATKAAIPSLVQALDDKDEIVRCMSFESLEQLQRSGHKELRDEANKLMQGVRARCSR